MIKREITALFVALLVFVAAGCSKQRESVVGTWHVTILNGENLASINEPPMFKAELKINSDGTYTEHVEHRMMGDIVINSKGKWVEAPGKLTLSGRQKGTTDDGYAKSVTDDPDNRTLAISGKELHGECIGSNVVYER